MTTRVALADDHDIVRRGLRSLIDSQETLELVGEAETGAEVTPMVSREQPDVLILDVMLPGLTGLEVLPRIREASPQTHVLVFSMHASERYATEALRAGATGYVVKEAETAELLRGVREVSAGRRFLSAPLSARKIDAYLRAGEDGPDPLAPLTPREREVFALAVRGNSNAGIAEALNLSSRTVEKHRAAAMRKLALSSQINAIRFAIEHGLLPADASPPD